MRLNPDDDDTRKALNRLAREQAKLRILADINLDLQVCKIEGWSCREYIDELIEMIGGIYDIRQDG